MPDTNPLLPTLEVLDPTAPWPGDLSEPAVAKLYEQTADYLQRVRRRAQELETVASRPGVRPAPPERADVLAMVWTARSAVAAQHVINAAGPAAGVHDEVLWHVLTAGITWHTAVTHPDDAGSDIVHDLHWRLEGAARWCRAAWAASESPRFTEYADTLFKALPPGFHPDKERPVPWAGTDDKEQVHTSWRRRPDGAIDSVRVAAVRNVIQEITVQRTSAEGAVVFGPKTLSFGELCVWMARAHAVPGGAQ